MKIFKTRVITEIRLCGMQESNQRIIVLIDVWSFKIALRITSRALAPLSAIFSVHIALYAFLSSEQCEVKLQTLIFFLLKINWTFAHGHVRTFCITKQTMVSVLFIAFQCFLFLLVFRPNLFHAHRTSLAMFSWLCFVLYVPQTPYIDNTYPFSEHESLHWTLY